MGLNMEKKVCMPRILKNTAYVLFPIFLTILILLIFFLTYPLERKSVEKRIDYFQTTTFAEDYSREIFSAITAINSIKENNSYRANGLYYIREENVSGNSNVEKINYYSEYYKTNVVWLIIDNKTKTAYTNLDYSIDTSNIANIQNKIQENATYWTYKDGNINTSVNKLSSEYIEYIKNGFDADDLSNYTIYTSVLDNLEYIDDISMNSILYDAIIMVDQKAAFLIPFLVVLIIALVPIIVLGVGRTAKQDGIKLNWFDKIFIELAALIAIFIAGIGTCFTISVNGVSNLATLVLAITIMAFGLFIIYLACILFFETVVKRLKTHTFLKTTIIYWLYIKIKELLYEVKITKRFILYFIIFIIANLICFAIMWSDGFPGIILSIILYALAYGMISKRIKSYVKVEDAINNLYQGNTDIELEEEEFVKEMKNMASQINDIAGGLSNAIDEKLKSERLKTELITNVSHDIKTPLTSIINYVDLLKKEGVDSEKAKEYLDILDSKSQRLKKLTEDLVEASKASSGALKLNMEKLNVNELIKQVSGEFEDKFKAHKLEEIIAFPEKVLYIKADSRYMYRILENMYSNISKYAMEGTRVYTDIIEKDGRIVIQLKNVSKQKLNISVDELMQRFVRGEASRNTEGSGLGLSIARSLTELQEGNFNIYLDGDLFKVTIEFNKEN